MTKPVQTSFLDAFEFVDEEWPTSVTQRNARERLIASLREQIELVKADREGRPFARHKNKRTGETVEQGVRRMYRKGDDGRYRLQVRYAQKPVELKPGKTMIRVGPDLGDVENAFTQIIQAVETGTLDEQIEQISRARSEMLRTVRAKKEGAKAAAQ